MTWIYGNMDICKYGYMEIWIYVNMDIWKYGNMDICKEFNRKMDLPYIRQLLNEESRERSYKRSICLHI